MAAGIHPLHTQRDKLRAEQALRLRQMVLTFDGLPERVVTALVATIDQETASRSGWTFVMLSPEQNHAVVKWLRENSALPLVAVVLWSACFRHLRRDTGEIAATRDELAKEVGTTANDVSRVMSELEERGAIIRLRDGRGVRYFMNPQVATHLTGAARTQAQEVAPQLDLTPRPKRPRRPKLSLVPT